MVFTYSDELYSDLHKDARGFRPGNSGYDYWDNLTPAEKQVQWDGLVREMNERYEEEQAEEKQAVIAFEAAVDQVIESGAIDRDQAIVWMVQAENDPYMFADPDFFCYKHGLPYGYLRGVI